MPEQNSGRFQLDWRNITHIVGAALLFLASTYLANTEAFNSLLAGYVSKDQFIAITGILAYGAKKFLTDYSNK